MPTLCPFAKPALLTDHSWPGTLQQKTEITLHITQGPTAISAINTFKASVAPHRTSSHFVVDANAAADIYQLLPVEDVGFHASMVNHRAIGIEHACIIGKQPASMAQYVASARLVAWLCKTLSIPCDRKHVREHCEASPVDGHTQCCHGALDPDKVVALACRDRLLREGI